MYNVTGRDRLCISIEKCDRLSRGLPLSSYTRSCINSATIFPEIFRNCFEPCFFLTALSFFLILIYIYQCRFDVSVVRKKGLLGSRVVEGWNIWKRDTNGVQNDLWGTIRGEKGSSRGYRGTVAKLTSDGFETCPVFTLSLDFRSNK